jgi:hypothetical protein
MKTLLILALAGSFCQTLHAQTKAKPKPKVKASSPAQKNKNLLIRTLR